MSTTAQIEDALIALLENLGIFKKVDSLGRNELPKALSYPSAYVYFYGDTEPSITNPRPTPDMKFHIQVVNKNVRSERQAAKDTYTLIDTVRDTVNGNDLGLTDIEIFRITAREMTDFADGVITYTLIATTRQYLSVLT